MLYSAYMPNLAWKPKFTLFLVCGSAVVKILQHLFLLKSIFYDPQIVHHLFVFCCFLFVLSLCPWLVPAGSVGITQSCLVWKTTYVWPIPFM